MGTDLAVTIGRKLLPHCERLNTAGSVRRRKAVIHDIELVAIPKLETLSLGLFDTQTQVSPQFTEQVAALGEIRLGRVSGRQMKIELPEGINLDLFLPQPDDYFRQLAIRIGPADYSKNVLAAGWRKIGWCGSDKGLRKVTDCQQRASGGKLDWFCVNENAEVHPCWPDEESFFDWINVDWIEPRLRF